MLQWIKLIIKEENYIFYQHKINLQAKKGLKLHSKNVKQDVKLKELQMVNHQETLITKKVAVISKKKKLLY